MKSVRAETLEPGTELVLAGFLVDGPHGSALVHSGAMIEPKIAALCENNGDDPDDYTASELFLLVTPSALDAERDRIDSYRRDTGAALLLLVGEYWNLAHREGAEGRTTDTEDGAAARTMLAITEHVRALVDALPVSLGPVPEKKSVPLDASFLTIGANGLRADTRPTIPPEATP